MNNLALLLPLNAPWSVRTEGHRAVFLAVHSAFRHPTSNDC